MDYEIQKPNNFNDYLEQKREYKLKNKEQILHDMMERQIKNKRKHEVTSKVRRNERLDQKKPKFDDDYYALPQDIYERGADVDDYKTKPDTGEDAYLHRLQKTNNITNTVNTSSANVKVSQASARSNNSAVKEKPKKFLLELRNVDKSEYLEEDLKELVPYCTNIIVDDNIYLVFSNSEDREKCRDEISGKIFGKKRIKIV
ncbi:hypothetical protein HDV06_006808 [Boothiomyces sp. JEL0866]|nr:hypothetical protein HDV06_006808 [Boothiomyces sp. JEL0866]